MRAILPEEITDGLRLRFWSKVRVGAPDACWEWQAAMMGRPVHGKQYGTFTIRRGVSLSASRIAWELTNGPIPAGKLVCHRCDNPPCVNPAHLFLGTVTENIRDMVAKGRKGRSPRGVENGLSKLDEAGIIEIRRLRSTGLSQQRIADQFGVSQPLVSAVLRGKIWRHVSEAA